MTTQLSSKTMTTTPTMISLDELKVRAIRLLKPNKRHWWSHNNGDSRSVYLPH